MAEKRWLIIVLALATMLAGSALAQDEKNEIGGTIGRTFISSQPIQGASFFDPNIRFGRGLSLEGNYARRIILKEIYSISGEVPVLYNPDEDLHAGGSSLVPKDYKALFVTPSVRVNLFPTTAVSPWASFGGGFGHISQSKLTLYDAANAGKNTTMAVLQYGVGLDVKFKGNLYIRGEGRDFWAGEPDFPQAPTGKTRQHNYYVGGGVFWRF